MKSPKKYTRSQKDWFLNCLLISQIIPFIALRVYRDLFPGLPKALFGYGLDQNDVIVLHTVFYNMFLLLILMLYVENITKENVQAYLPFQYSSYKELFWKIIIGYITMRLLSILFATLVQPFMSQAALENTENLRNIKHEMLSNRSWKLFSACIVIPIVEEMYYRGFFYHSLEKSGHPALAIVLTSVIFGSMHTDVSLLSRAMIGVLGLVVAFIRYKTTSLCVPIGIHMLNNYIALQ